MVQPCLSSGQSIYSLLFLMKESVAVFYQVRLNELDASSFHFIDLFAGHLLYKRLLRLKRASRLSIKGLGVSLLFVSKPLPCRRSRGSTPSLEPTAEMSWSSTRNGASCQSRVHFWPHAYTRHIASVEDRYVRYSMGHEERPGQ